MTAAQYSTKLFYQQRRSDLSAPKKALSVKPARSTLKSYKLSPEELNTFRTSLCHEYDQKRSCYRGGHCTDSHCPHWIRRDPSKYSYCGYLCPLLFKRGVAEVVQSSDCPDGINCRYSHSKEEQMYHPRIYKTAECKDYPSCLRVYCQFAHGSAELSQKPRPKKKYAQSPQNTSETISLEGLAEESHAIRTMSSPTSPPLSTPATSVLAEPPFLPLSMMMFHRNQYTNSPAWTGNASFQELNGLNPTIPLFTPPPPSCLSYLAPHTSVYPYGPYCSLPISTTPIMDPSMDARNKGLLAADTANCARIVEPGEDCKSSLYIDSNSTTASCPPSE